MDQQFLDYQGGYRHEFVSPFSTYTCLLLKPIYSHLSPQFLHLRLVHDDIHHGPAVLGYQGSYGHEGEDHHLTLVPPRGFNINVNDFNTRNINVDAAWKVLVLIYRLVIFKFIQFCTAFSFTINILILTSCQTRWRGWRSSSPFSRKPQRSRRPNPSPSVHWGPSHRDPVFLIIITPNWIQNILNRLNLIMI